MYSAVVSQEVFQGRLEPWRWGKQWLPSEVDDDQLRGSDPLTTTQEVAQELSVYHSIVVWHLKQTGKVKKLDKWMPHELTAKKKKIDVLKCHLLIYATTSYFSIGLWYAMKSGFYTTTSDDQLSGWTKKKFQSTSQSQLPPKTGSWALFGDLLLVWATTVFWIPVKPFHLKSMLGKSMRRTENCSPAGGVGHQKGPNSSPLWRPSARRTTSTSKAERIGLWSFASSSMFTWPFGNQLPLLQASRQLLARNNASTTSRRQKTPSKGLPSP